MDLTTIAVLVVGAIMLFTGGDLSKIIDKLKSLFIKTSSKTADTSQDALLDKVSLWKQLYVLVEDEETKKALNDLFPKLNSAIKEAAKNG